MTDPKPHEAALAAVRDKTAKDVHVLASGVRARLRSVPAPLIDSATSRIKDPKVPTFFNEEKGREEENPNHPDYISALDEANTRRGLAGMDVMIVVGVELLDAVPEDEHWLPNLKMLERLGHLDLGGFDLKDTLDREFVYKKFVAVGQADYEVIARKSGVSVAEVDAADRSFQGN